jgi:hypothetical protein
LQEPADMAQNSAHSPVNKRAIPKPRLVLGTALEKAVKSPLFPLNPRLFSQNLRFWESFTLFVKRFFLRIFPPCLFMPRDATAFHTPVWGDKAENS